MAFFLTLLYVAVALLSPNVLPQFIMELHVNEILGILVILALLPSIPEAQLGSIPETYLVFGVFLASVVSIVATGWLGHVLPAILGFFPIVFAFYFVLISCRTLRRLQILVFVLFAVAVFIFAQGALANHAGNVTSDYLFTEKNDDGSLIYRYRGLGVLSDPNDLAQMFVMIIPLLWLTWKKGKFLGNLLLTILPAAILMAGVFYTHSRGGVVAFIAVCLFGFKDKLGIVKSSVLAGVLLAGLVALNITGGRGMNEDDGGRVAAWITGLQVLKSHPLFGIGIGNFGDYNETGSTAHNSYILALAEIGIFGYFFWMGSIVATWGGLSQIIRSQVKPKPLDAFSAGNPQAPRLGNMPYMRPLLQSSGPSGNTLQARTATVPSFQYPNQLVRPMPATRQWGPAAFYGKAERITGDSSQGDQDDQDEKIIHMAKTVRVAFVGLLTSSFFLSRSFSMVFFLCLAMSACLKLIYREQHPDKIAKDQTLIKRIWMVIFSSIVLLYIFVRVRGVH